MVNVKFLLIDDANKMKKQEFISCCFDVGVFSQPNLLTGL